jgi:hypothetical protein
VSTPVSYVFPPCCAPSAPPRFGRFRREVDEIDTPFVLIKIDTPQREGAVARAALADRLVSVFGHERPGVDRRLLRPWRVRSRPRLSWFWGCTDASILLSPRLAPYPLTGGHTEAPVVEEDVRGMNWAAWAGVVWSESGRSYSLTLPGGFLGSSCAWPGSKRPCALR